MASSRKRGSSAETSEDDYEQAVEDLADAVVENLPDPEEIPLEPFEDYVQRMKLKVYSDASHFKVRFSKGYHVLMAELSKYNPSKQ